MRLLPLAALALTLVLGACGSSQPQQTKWYNPFSWFGNSQEVPMLTTTGAPQPDMRPSVQQVLSMSVDETPGGAIIRATGLPPTQGYWEGALVDEKLEDGRLTYRFVLLPPSVPHPVSTQQSREVTVATAVSNIKLEGVREIVIEGATNARSARR